MDLNIEAWPEIVFNYGPYAILVLFVMWVIPRASKRTHDITKTAPKLVRVSAMTTLVASWAVVLVMVGYVLFKWSPMRVYEGELGVLWQTEKIYPLDDNVYVKVGGADVPNRETWRFVLLDRESQLKEQDNISFTYYWGSNEKEYTDYLIPVGLIINGDLKDFRFTKKDPEAIYSWSGDQWKLASAASEPTVLAFDWGWQAHAAGDAELRAIAQQLASPNRVTRAQARNAMRSLSDSELRALLEMTSSEEAVHQIQLEQARRSR